MGDLVEPVDVVERHRLQVVKGVVVLVNLLLELLEDLGAIRPLRFNEPVLRIEEDLSVGLPDAVALHPLPLRPRFVLRINDDAVLLFLPHEAALDEELHRCVGLDHACRHLARAHLHIDEEVIEESVSIAVHKGVGAGALRQEVGLECRGTPLADRIHHRRRDFQPIVIRIARLQNSLGGRRGCLIGGGDAPAHELGTAAAGCSEHRRERAQSIVDRWIGVVTAEGDADGRRQGCDVARRPAGNRRERRLGIPFIGDRAARHARDQVIQTLDGSRGWGGDERAIELHKEGGGE